jgi:hypothetical protein
VPFSLPPASVRSRPATAGSLASPVYLGLRKARQLSGPALRAISRLGQCFVARVWLVRFCDYHKPRVVRPLGEASCRLGARLHRPLTHGSSFAKWPKIWGALYALEGSRLGNRTILHRVMDAVHRMSSVRRNSLPTDKRTAPYGASSWRTWMTCNSVVRHSSWRYLGLSKCSRRTSSRQKSTRNGLAGSFAP